MTMRVLVLGATGMLGSAVYRAFVSSTGIRVRGTSRSSVNQLDLPTSSTADLAFGVCANDLTSIRSAIEEFDPDAVINCIGIVKQLDDAEDPLIAIPVNSLLPHQLAALCRELQSRLIHISTDCVFSGARGNYAESDLPDATDLYGRSKLLGEATGPGCVTLRTSIIGPEPSGRASGLLDWFLSQSGPVRGYRRAIFSGLPTIVLAEVIRDHVLARPHLQGRYHVGALPIDKFSLLQLIRSRWGRDTEIVPCELPVIDRSLDCSLFRSLTGFHPPPWPWLIERMHAFG
jgi:dTDP-4-dehydrorhamnose reductase